MLLKKFRNFNIVLINLTTLVGKTNINQKNKMLMKTNKKKYSILVVLMLFIGSFVYASFPVKENNKSEAIENVKYNAKNFEKKTNAQFKAFQKSDVESKISPAKGAKDDDKLITILLWFFLGFVAAHRWYKKKPVGWNILFILTGGGCGIWAIVDLINIITDKF